jgi:hypothetical protein
MDEAWQVLYHMRRLPNPLLPKTTLIKYLREVRRAFLSRSVEIYKIYGASSFSDLRVSAKIVCLILVLLLAIVIGLSMLSIFIYWKISSSGALAYATQLDIPPHLLGRVIAASWGLFAFIALWSVFIFGWAFYSALWSPIRWIARQIESLSVLPIEIGYYIARKRAWPLLQTLAMGLDGYRYDLPEVSQTPKADASFVKYEEMPIGAQQRALERRNAWIGKNFGVVSETFSKMVVTSADITSLLKMVENDLTLVHAAYYTDDECIERIADWIAYQK